MEHGNIGLGCEVMYTNAHVEVVRHKMQQLGEHIEDLFSYNDTAPKTLYVLYHIGMFWDS